MASHPPKKPLASQSKPRRDNTPVVLLVRSDAAQHAFVTNALQILEALGQHGRSTYDANRVMDAGFQIEAAALEHDFRVVASMARSLSTQAAELYLRDHTVIATSALESTIDVLSALMLRVYLSGTDVDPNAPRPPGAHPARKTVSTGYLH